MIFSYLWWLIPALVLLVSVLIGAKDFGRFSLYRARAVASVCFRESIRRRVLMVIPLAILGVLAVSAFTKSVDEQDSIRQTLKFCLFASGLLIFLTLVILACTNLPREIDNRVIYTIVTKPTTRLEIIVGKVMGFAGVSAVVLLVMGLFTGGYLGVQAAASHRAIGQRMTGGEAGKGEQASLEHYERFGLLTAKRLAFAKSLQVSTQAFRDADEIRWFGYSAVNDVVVPFDIPAGSLDPVLGAADGTPATAKLMLSVQMMQRRRLTIATEASSTRPSTQQSEEASSSIQVNLLDRDGNVFADSSMFQGQSRKLSGTGVAQVFLEIPKPQADVIGKNRRIFVQIVGETLNAEYGAGKYPVQLAVVGTDGKLLTQMSAVADSVDRSRQLLVFRGRQGRAGQQVEGSRDGKGTIGVYQFRDVDLKSSDASIGLEMKVTLERSSDDDDVEGDALTEIELAFQNPLHAGAPIVVRGYPENNRTMYLTVPREAIEGGNFDVLYRSMTNSSWVSADLSGLSIVVSREPFLLNLFSSLFVLWLMSLLVIVVAVFTSTFLSWPIAVVLTMLILLSRWVLDQLGDALDSSIGNTMVSTMGVNDPNASKVISKSVVTLTEAFKAVASILPDITSFSAFEHIQQGLAVPMVVLAHSGLTLLLFGLPLLALSYVFLKYKEVAP